MGDATLSADMDAFLVTADNAAARTALGVINPASPGAIGGTTPAAGTFTDLTANSLSSVTGDFYVSGAATGGSGHVIIRSQQAAASVFLRAGGGGNSDLEVKDGGDVAVRGAISATNIGEKISFDGGWGSPASTGSKASLADYAGGGALAGLDAAADAALVAVVAWAQAMQTALAAKLLPNG